MNYEMLPEHCRESVQAYIETGRPMGNFLEAVFSNDLVESFGRADATNRERLHDYCVFLYNQAPAHPVRCWGSEEIVQKWMGHGGLAGL